MSDPKMIREIMDTVTIPVMAKARIGHFVECQVCLMPQPVPAASLMKGTTGSQIHSQSLNIYANTLSHRSSKPSV